MLGRFGQEKRDFLVGFGPTSQAPQNNQWRIGQLSKKSSLFSKTLVMLAKALPFPIDCQLKLKTCNELNVQQLLNQLNQSSTNWGQLQ